MSDDAFSRLTAKYGERSKKDRKARREAEEATVESNIDDILSGGPKIDELAQVQQISANHRRNIQARQAQNDAVDQMLLQTLGPKEPPIADRKAADEHKRIAEHRETEGDQFMQNMIDILDGADDQYGRHLQQRLRDTLEDDNSDTTG